MKVALVIRKYDPAGGGAERWTHRHACMLAAEGHEVHIVATQIYNPPDILTCHIINGGARPRPRTRVRIADRMASFLKSQNYDVIHDMGVGWHFNVFMPHHGTHRAVYDQRTTALMMPERALRKVGYNVLPRYRQFQAIEHRQYAPSPDKLFVAVSNMVSLQMQAHHGVPEDRIRMVYNGVDINRFHPVESVNAQTRANLRKQWGFEDRTVFLIVAEDFDLKGVGTIIRAIARMHKAERRIGFVVVGAGEMKGHKICGISTGRASSRFPRLARQLGCADVIKFVGSQDAPLAYYQAADVYVQPSLYDACSLVVLEAMACGLPVITSQHNGVSALIDEGIEGHVLDDPRNADVLAALMERFTDPTLRATAGRCARKRAEGHSAHFNYQQILDVYNEHLRQKSEGSSHRSAEPRHCGASGARE